MGKKVEEGEQTQQVEQTQQAEAEVDETTIANTKRVSSDDVVNSSQYETELTGMSEKEDDDGWAR